MGDHRYTLDNTSRKFICPSCQKRKYVKMVDTELQIYLPEEYGRCDGEGKCGYHLKYKSENSYTAYPTRRLRRKAKPKRTDTFIPFEVLKNTRSHYDVNTFIQNLLSNVDYPFDAGDIEKVISLYHLGTINSGYRSGANTFPFIDIEGNVRAIQAKQFDKNNSTVSTDFIHSILKKEANPVPSWIGEYDKNEKKVSCLFGEHLLKKYPHNPIALVEAPKTAVYGSLYFGFPEDPNGFLWLAVYNLSSLNTAKCKALTGRDVYLFPDLSTDGRAHRLWSEKAKTMQDEIPNVSFTVSDFLEKIASDEDKKDAKDLADFLITRDWRQFRKGAKSAKDAAPEKKYFKNKKSKSLEPVQIKPEKVDDGFSDYDTPVVEFNEDWTNDIDKLEKYFNEITLDQEPIVLSPGTTIADPVKFIKSSLSIAKHNNGNIYFKPYFTRLKTLKSIIHEQ